VDAETGTWPDLRTGGQRRGTARRIGSPAIGTWCHGEGGIALVRLRAIDVLGHKADLVDAEVALEATRRHLSMTLRYEIGDLSLCHGAAGAADVLLCGAAALGGRWRDAEALSAELGHAAIERHATTDEAWPCDSADGTTPALFRGLSGIAWWFLRMHDPAVPSPLRLPISS
jgi:lantibiotic modifying enzyme